MQHGGFVRIRRRDGTMVVSEVVPLGCGTKARKSFISGRSADGKTTAATISSIWRLRMLCMTTSIEESHHFLSKAIILESPGAVRIGDARQRWLETTDLVLVL